MLSSTGSKGVIKCAKIYFSSTLLVSYSQEILKLRCIQNDKYAKAYVEVPLTQNKALKEQASDGNTGLMDNLSNDPRTRLVLDFHPIVSGTSFRLYGDLVLWGNTSLLYPMLNATLWDSGL